MPGLDIEGYLRRRGKPTAALPEDEPMSLPGTQLAPAAAAPGAASSVDPMDRIVEALTATREQPNDFRSSIGRALTGFARGAAAVPREAGYNPILGALVGGASGVGQTFEAEEARRLKLDEPRREVLKNIMTSQAKEAIEEPYRLRKEGRDEARGREKEKRQKGYDQENIRLRAKLAGDNMRSAAQQQAAIQGVPPDIAQRYYAEAVNEQKALGITEDTPGFDAMALKSYAAKLDAHKKARTPIPTPGASGAAGGDAERAAARAALGLQ